MKRRFEGKPVPPGGCLLCRGDHWVQICHTSTVKQRREAFAKFKAERDAGAQKSSAKTPANKHVEVLSDIQNTTLYRVKVNDLLTYPCELDNGSARTTIDLQELKELQSLKQVLYKEFATPIAGTQAIEGSTTMYVGTDLLDLTLDSSIGVKVTLR